MDDLESVRSRLITRLSTEPMESSDEAQSSSKWALAFDDEDDKKKRKHKKDKKSSKNHKHNKDKKQSKHDKKDKKNKKGKKDKDKKHKKSSKHREPISMSSTEYTTGLKGCSTEDESANENDSKSSANDTDEANTNDTDQTQTEEETTDDPPQSSNPNRGELSKQEKISCKTKMQKCANSIKKRVKCPQFNGTKYKFSEKLSAMAPTKLKDRCNKKTVGIMSVSVLSFVVVAIGIIIAGRYGSKSGPTTPGGMPLGAQRQHSQQKQEQVHENKQAKPQTIPQEQSTSTPEATNNPGTTTDNKKLNDNNNSNNYNNVNNVNNNKYTKRGGYENPHLEVDEGDGYFEQETHEDFSELEAMEQKKKNEFNEHRFEFEQAQDSLTDNINSRLQKQNRQKSKQSNNDDKNEMKHVATEMIVHESNLADDIEALQRTFAQIYHVHRDEGYNHYNHHNEFDDNGNNRESWFSQHYFGQLGKRMKGDNENQKGSQIYSNGNTDEDVYQNDFGEKTRDIIKNSKNHRYYDRYYESPCDWSWIECASQKNDPNVKYITSITINSTTVPAIDDEKLVLRGKIDITALNHVSGLRKLVVDLDTGTHVQSEFKVDLSEFTKKSPLLSELRLIDCTLRNNLDWLKLSKNIQILQLQDPTRKEHFVLFNEKFNMSNFGTLNDVAETNDVVQYEKTFENDYLMYKSHLHTLILRTNTIKKEATIVKAAKNQIHMIFGYQSQIAPNLRNIAVKFGYYVQGYSNFTLVNTEPIDTGTNIHNPGRIIYLHDQLNSQLLQDIGKLYKDNYSLNGGRYPILLFSDNMADKKRLNKTKTCRNDKTGQSGVIRDYNCEYSDIPTNRDTEPMADTSFAFGIPTGVRGKNKFRKEMTNSLHQVQHYVDDGYDIIIPAPTGQGIMKQKRTYLHKVSGVLVVHHCLGVNNTQRTQKSLQYIEQKIADLVEKGSFKIIHASNITFMEPQPGNTDSDNGKNSYDQSGDENQYNDDDDDYVYNDGDSDIYRGRDSQHSGTHFWKKHPMGGKFLCDENHPNCDKKRSRPRGTPQFDSQQEMDEMGRILSDNLQAEDEEENEFI